MSYSRPHLHHQLLNHPPQPQPAQPQHPHLQQHPHQLAPPQQQQTQQVPQVQHHQQLPLQQQQQHMPVLAHPLHHQPPPPPVQAQYGSSSSLSQQQQRSASSAVATAANDSGSGSGKKKTQQSWVWNYFSKIPGQDGIMYAVCQLPSASPGSGKGKSRRKDAVDDDDEDEDDEVDVNVNGGMHGQHPPRRSTDFMREVVGVTTTGERPAGSVGSQDDASGSGGKCNAQYKYIQGTKNLIRHLIRTHNIFKTTAPATAHDIAALAAAAANPNANSYSYGDEQRAGNAAGGNGADSRYSWMSADSLSGAPSSTSFMSAAAPTYMMQEPSPMAPPTTNKLKHWSDEELIALLQAHHDVRSARGTDAEFLPLDDLVEDTYAAFCARQEQILQQQQQQPHAGDDSEGADQIVRRPPKAVYDKLYGLVSSYKFITDYEEDRINRERSAIGTAIATSKKPWWDMSPSDHRRVLGKNRTWLSKSVYNTVAILMPQSLLRRNGTRPSRRNGEEDGSDVSESDSPNAARVALSVNKRRRARTSTAGSQSTPTGGRKKRNRAETLLRTLADAMHDVSGSEDELDEGEAELLGAAATGRRRARSGGNFERQMLTEQAAQTSLLRTLVEQQTRMMGALEQALRGAESH
ncbi:hypothetical protein V1517DRAFT_319015 [Lipomyces orientalis]|uniref:Uncharacterized protein n=1 Tax=Lipomyces orientalis TaxID=1233043 RepID=A0ACC3TSM5_9ASCO